MSHRVTIEREPGGHRAVCVCRASSRSFPFRWEAEDWQLQHLDLVNRVHTHLSHGRSPSLASQRDYFRSKADDVNTPVGDRPVWKQLADELDKRLNDTQVDDAPGLW
jgi:hypothetical protein